MRQSWLNLGLVLVAVGVSSLLAPRAVRAAGPASARTPVLVELFTSEGCSSCPPADRLLRELDRKQPVAGAEILVLGEHVDYWDQLGWHDRFSSALFTARQEMYVRKFGLAGPYTPQMVIDGRQQVVGSDEVKAEQAIRNAALRPKQLLTLTTPFVAGLQVSGSLSLKAQPGSATFYAALVDPLDTTVVGSGENGGKRLLHAGVVRTLRRLDSPAQTNATALPFTLLAPSGAEVFRMRLVVFAVDDHGGVIAAANLPVSPESPLAAGG